MRSLFDKASVPLPSRIEMTPESFPLLYAKQHVVAIGGGHGLGRLLSSLSFLGERLTGIVTTTDNGGSSGRLRTETGCIAWGDLRNCLNQLCSEPTLGRLLFEYRFAETAGSLAGHNLGNIMLLALDQLCARPVDAVELVRNVLDVKAEIIPMAEMPASLVALYEGDRRVDGEVLVNDIEEMPEKLILEPMVTATPEAVTAIEHADLILIGPGSFLTSITPPLLLPEIVSAIKDSNANTVLIANIGEENNFTGKWSPKELLQWLRQAVGQDIVNAVLWPQNRQCENGNGSGADIFEAALIDSSGKELHDPKLLLASLEELLHKLG